ncbi:MAG: DNA gyrase inhibitor YacG [Planctomycetes bacterium]|nr:DNA gyrase inhibitor YacG [Planctomycetota bacterium]
MTESDNSPVVKCPTCGKKVTYTGLDENPYFPFCGKRCKLMDLDKWFEEEHRIEKCVNERIERGDLPEESES